MELRDYWRLIIQSFPIIVASVLLGVGGAAVVTFTATPQYVASAQMFISTPAAALDISALAVGSSFSQQRVKSYSQIINGLSTLGPVIEELKLDTTPGELASRVTASAPLDTVLITVRVTDPDPAKAAAIANAVTKQFAITVDTLEIAQAGGGSPVKVSTVKTAVPPGAPSSPKKSLNLLMGLVLGFGLGLGIATLRRIFDNTVKNEEQLDGLPLLTAIGFDEEAAAKPLVTQIGRYSSRAEAFRQLRTNLQFIRSDNPPRVIAVSSALPSEGKTTTSINLAITLSQAGFKVVLVEADLRRPKIANYFPAAKGAEGLSELLSGRVKFSSLTALKESLLSWGDDGLCVIPSGAIPPNPAELLNSLRMDRVLEALRESFDYVIIDTAPLLPVTDAALVASKADGVVITCRAGVTKTAEFKGAVEAITAVGSTVLGVVLNMIPHQRGSGEYGYRYGSSKYYGSRKYRPYSGKYAPAGKYAPSSTYAPNQE